MSRRQAGLALLFLAAALVLLVWSVWLVITLPYGYVSAHRGSGWARLRRRAREPSLSNLTTNREGASS